LIAPPALQLLVKFAARFTTRAGEVKIDWPVLLFTLLASIVAGILAGFVPAISSSRQITDALKQATGQTTTSGSRQRMRAALVVAQVTVSFMLLVGAGLMLRSILSLQSVDPGFRVDHLLTLRMSANFSKYTTNQDFEQLADNVLRKVSAVGGVESAAIASNYPFSKQGIISGPGNSGILIEGRLLSPGETPPQVDLTLVSPDYFNAIRQPLLAGRFFTDHDDHKAVTVGIVNQTMRRHFWPTEDPIGKRISIDQGESWIKIAGVVGDAREYGLQRDVLDELYVPVKQFGGAGQLIVRTAADPMSMVPLVRAALHDVDPQLAVDRVESMDRLAQDSLTSPRTTTMLLGIFAGLALLISATGIAGVMALSINQRAHELGIRLALGQSKNSLLQMVLRQGLTLAVIGTVMGIIGALALARLLSSLLYHTSPTDAFTYGAVAIVFLSAAAVACFIPAHRVTMIDPSQALRQE
jgi:putative ABC transport system permease protein